MLETIEAKKKIVNKWLMQLLYKLYGEKMERKTELDDELRGRLAAAMDWCDHEDKSTEFMIEYMKDSCNTTHDVVMEFLEEC